MKIHTSCFSKQLLQGHWIEPFLIHTALINHREPVSANTEAGFFTAALLSLFNTSRKALNTLDMDLVSLNHVVMIDS